MKIRNIMFTLAIIAIAAFSFIEANGSEKLSDVTLANIEALANNENVNNQYYCYGVGNVRCPYSGELVAGYIMEYKLE